VSLELLNAAMSVVRRMSAGNELNADGPTYHGERALTQFRGSRGHDVAQMGRGMMVLHNLAASSTVRSRCFGHRRTPCIIKYFRGK